MNLILNIIFVGLFLLFAGLIYLGSGRDRRILLASAAIIVTSVVGGTYFDKVWAPAHETKIRELANSIRYRTEELDAAMKAVEYLRASRLDTARQSDH